MKALGKQADKVLAYVESCYSVAKDDLRIETEHSTRFNAAQRISRLEGEIEAYEKVLGYLEALTYGESPRVTNHRNRKK